MIILGVTSSQPFQNVTCSEPCKSSSRWFGVQLRTPCLGFPTANFSLHKTTDGMAHAMAGNFSLFACFNHDAARCSKFPRNTSGSPSD